MWNVPRRTVGSPSSMRSVLGKASVVAMLVAVMQVVAVVTTVVLGMATLGVPGPLPPRYLVASVLIVVASVSVAALQSWLSMQLRSFAAPSRSHSWEPGQPPWRWWANSTPLSSSVPTR